MAVLDECILVEILLIKYQNSNFKVQKMDIFEKKTQKFVLTFIDEEAVNANKKKRSLFSPQRIKDDISIDFSLMLQRQWTVQPQEYIFNTKSKLQVQKARKIAQTIKKFNVQAEQTGLVSHRQKNKTQKRKNLLLDVQTIFPSPIPQEQIEQFLQSEWFHICLRFFVILFNVGLILTDYSFRQAHHNQDHKQYSLSNILSLHFQLIANCAFTLQILLKMFCKKPFFENPWNILNIVGCVACWGCIFLSYEAYDGNPIFHILSILKILLGMRIIQIFQIIKNPFQSFISAIPELGKIFFPYFIFISMYAVLGLILFSGANQYRCRETPQPVDGIWPQVSQNLCGSNSFECAKGYCGNPFYYGLPQNRTEIREIKNQYGLATYDNFGKATLTTYHYVFLSNWTNIKYKYSKYIHPYIATFYFFTMALFLFFIMSNLNMITISKSFIERQKSKQKLKKQTQAEVGEKQKNGEQRMTEGQLRFYTILKFIDIILVLFCAIVILIEYDGMSHKIKSLLNKVDFVLTIICFVVILAKTLILKKGILLNKFIIFDWVIITMNLCDFIHCLAVQADVLDPQLTVSVVLRNIKLARIIEILYISESWFSFEKTILKIFVETLNTVKYFILLLLCVLMILAFIGQNLFAFRAKFNHDTHLLDMEHGSPYVVNFNSLYKAMVAVTYLMENERWTETMYNYYQAVGWVAVAYFTIVVFIIHLLLTRLFIAIFLCYFRRNLQKKNQKQENSQKFKPALCQQCGSSSKSQIPVAQFLQNPSQVVPQRKQQSIKKQACSNGSQNTFQSIRRNYFLFQIVRTCHNSVIFNKLKTILIILHCLTIVFRTNQDGEEKTTILDILECISLYFYILETVLGIIGHGLITGDNTYLKQSKMNYINILVSLLVIVSEIKVLGLMETRIIRRFAILKILTFFTNTNKETSIVLGSISAISQSFIRMIIMYVFILLISCLLPLKLGKQKLYSCENIPHNFQAPGTPKQCMLIGGDWIRDAQSFANIFQSLALMYQVITSESWTYFIERFKDNPWDFFFVLNFFICNICLLNIFVGMTVQTYLSLKDEAYKLNLLRPNQRMWLLIRNSINELIPVPIIHEPENGNKFRKLSFFIISQPIYQNFIDVLPYINVLVYAFNYYRAQQDYLSDLSILNTVIITIFMVDTILKLQLHWNFFYLDNSKIQLYGFIYHIFYGLFLLFGSVNHQSNKSMQFISALLLILRCKKLIFRFTWCKTLLNSVIQILPKCIVIGALLAVILFFYVSIGMQIFKYTKPTPKSDGYTTGFNNFFTSLMTLLKIVSNQSWFEQVSAHVRSSIPTDICFTISSMEDAIQYPFMGCGSKAGYIYFISFHMIIALLVLNLLIATMVAAYDQNYQKQYKSVNIFQLQDCLKLWQKYDPNGTGLIPYKKFWRLSSQIAILFGISKKKLIKSKQKFLEQLDIDVCQSIDPNNTSVLCYKFHDVLTKFSKVKLTVSKTDNEQGNDIMDFQIHPMIERQIKDYITNPPPLYEYIKSYKNLKSGEMKYFFVLLRKMRAWRIVAKKKDSSVISKLSHIIKVALEKKQKQQQQMKRMRGEKSSQEGHEQ